MQLKRILLENVCQFSSLDHTFHPGLTGIIGPNGSGKSNLVKSIYFALTGIFRNAGVKADNIAQLGKGTRSSVTLFLEHDGVAMEIVRGLSGVRTQLRIDGEPKPIFGDTTVTEKVMEILGVGGKVLAEYVFILQLHMTDFIEATPSDRAKVFQRLFGTDECEAVNAFIMKVIDKELKIVTQADLPAIQARLDGNTQRMAGLIDRLEQLDDMVTIGAARGTAARQLVANAEWSDNNARELGRLTQQMAAINGEEVAYAQSRDTSKRELDALEEALRDVEIDAQNARVALATWKTAEARRARACTLARRRERLEADAAATTRPAERRNLTADEKSELSKLWARHTQLERQIELAKTGQAECPTCGQPVVGLPDEAELRRVIGEVDGRIEELQDLRSQHERYVAAARAWEQWHDKHIHDMNDLAADELALEGEQVEGSDVDSDLLQETIDLEVETRSGIAMLQKRHQNTSRECARLKGQWDQLHARHEELVIEGRKRAVDPEALHQAKADIARLDDLWLEREHSNGEVSELARSLDADEALLARLKAIEAENTVTRQLLAGAHQVADVTHRNAVPRLVSEAHLDRLIDDIDDALELFGADFRVRLGPGLSFMADFVDGRSQAGGRLSEGQKAVLALAFWVAVNSLFARQIGFLSLDEPTSSLDQQNIGALEVALKQLRELSESTGLQCLLVTHERSLAGLFDSVLSL